MKPLVAVASVTIIADGATLPPTRIKALSAVRVEHGLSEPAQCELTFVDGECPLAIGTAMELTVTGQTATLFAGEVTAIQHHYEPMRGRVIRVRAYDRLHRLRKISRVRTHVRCTLADIAGALATDVGLGFAGETGPLWTHLVQHQRHDFDFLADLCERCGLFFTARDGIMRLITLAGDGEAIELALGDTLLEAEIDCNGDGACRSVETFGWNPRRAQAHRGSADQARSGRDVGVEAGPDQFGLEGKLTRPDAVVENDAQAEALAQAALDRRVAAEIVFSGVAEGDTRLIPGCRIETRGMTPEHCGRYVLTAVVHTINAERGFLTQIHSGPPPLRARPALPIAALGTVTRIDDPENLGRVQVALPGYGGIETDWLEVLAAGAGAGKGLVATPDHDDQVLVLFPNGDPAHGIAIGGLYGVGGMHDDGIDGGAVKRFSFQTPGGQRVLLDDAGNRVRIQNKRGSYVELAPNQVTVHANDADLRLEAPGRTVSVRGANIDFAKA